MSEQRDNSGVIFANDRKTKDSDPDGKGTATISGVEYWVASWVNQGKNGVMYRKLSFTPKANSYNAGATSPKTGPDVGGQRKSPPPSQPQAAQPEPPDTSSDIPF